MKLFKFRVEVLGAAATLAATTLAIQAQTDPQESPSKRHQGQVLQIQTQAGSLSGPAVDHPALPDQMPEAIRERLQLFERKREEYLAKQLELVRQLRGATDAERAELRERIREQRQAWLEEARKIREQARARLLEMKRELVNHAEVIEAAREKAREQVREQARERRGTD